MSEWIGLAELVFVMVGGSVEDERKFSAMSFIKNKQRNKLQASHLSMCVRMFADELYSVGTFPYAQALKWWRKALASKAKKAGKKHRGRYTIK